MQDARRIHSVKFHIQRLEDLGGCTLYLAQVRTGGSRTPWPYQKTKRSAGAGGVQEQLVPTMAFVVVCWVFAMIMEFST